MIQQARNAQAEEAAAHAISVGAGGDRFNQSGQMIWGMIPLSIKVSTQDTGGGLMMFEHRDMGKGGPPRHIHHNQDEWFYVVKGEYEFEVGERRYRLGPGDTLFAPRATPHGWACVSDQPGTLLTMVSPAGTFESFILETTKHPTVPSKEEVALAFEAHDMKVVGPPLI